MALNTQWKPRLETPDPTLAEYLASRGYQTAGFAANTYCCTYESGFNRGFQTYEDYSKSPAAILARIVPGMWLLEHGLDLLGQYHARKWVSIQSRDAAAINGAFLDWLGRRRTDRPFFAFLNYFDAHDAFIPPPAFLGRFGIKPASRRDYQFLAGALGVDHYDAPIRNVLMARDGYDSCIAYLDEQLGRLLGELDRRGLLAETDVIITSDHGEAFGEHGTIGHSNGVLLEETRVPLVILGPGAPTGGRIHHPVSLRDLPATVVDRVGLGEGSPFPGRSLASYWGLPAGQMPPQPTTLAFSEQANRTARMQLRPMAGPGGPFPGFRMSLVAWGHQYIRNGEGGEELYDLSKDPLEKVNAAPSPESRAVVEAFRAMLLDVLDESPGSTEVERAYLKDYRQALRSQVRGASAGKLAGESRPGPDGAGPIPGPGS
jgi:arylsulfatase A-like enzyme